MIGAELRKERLAAGLTQEQLAHKASVSRNYVSLLEHDQKSPTVEVLMRLCAALGIRASTLLARVEQTRRRKKRRR